MAIHVGIDVQPIDEVESSLREFGTRYTRRLFTDAEVERCGTDPAVAASGLAARFAAKEAVLKVLDLSELVPPWTSIEVRQTSPGRPEIVLHGATADLLRRQGVTQLSLSLTHAGGVAAAAVVAVSP